MAKFADRVKVTVDSSTSGTGTVTLSTAVSGYQSVPSALDGASIRYVIELGTAWEIGLGTYTHSTLELTRSLTSSSTGSLLSLNNTAVVFISPAAEDLQYVEVYSSTSDLPSASSNHGRITHVHGDGAMYFAHGGNWVRLGNHSDITSYTLPTASSSTLGGIKIGSGLSIDGSGVVTASGSSGIALTDLSVTQNSASGTGALSYNNSSGVFSYTPPASSGSSSTGGSLEPITTTKTTATAGQTVFTGTWKAENISVFLNGVKLQDSEVTATDTQITISATAVGDVVEVVEYGAPFASPYASTFPTVTTGATSVTVDYTPDKVAVYKNGVKLRGGGVDFTASNGTSITGFSAFAANDVVEVVEHGSLASTPNNIVDLSDTPSSLGTAGQILQVNSGANALEFADAGGTGVTVHTNQAAMLTDAASADEGSLHYENANNKLYVKQTSGFFLLASITNTAPTVSGFTETTGGGSANTISDNGTFTLTSGSNTVISLTATDPDLETLVYSATVTSGTASNVISSPSLPISNQSGNTFTLTPVTSGVGGTITIRFDVSDGNNVVNKTHSFSIAFQVADSNHTTLLATATGTSDNNNITDSSSNSHSITVNGDAYAGTFSPYRSGGYSLSLNGTDESFEPNHSSASGLGTTWSVSYWAYIPSSGATNGTPYIFDFDRFSSGNGFALQANLTFKNFNISMYNLGAIINTATSLTCFDKWSYYVITHSSGTTTFYIDGSSVGSSTASGMANVSAAKVQQLVIGADGGATSSYHTKMDVRDFHVRSAAHNGAVNNEAAVADSNTVVLAAHKPYLASQTGASTALTPVINNDVSTKPFSPYDYNEYSTTDHGGSVYFDGSGDVSTLTLGTSLGTSNFTIEAWVYPTLISASWKGVLSTKLANSSSYWSLGYKDNKAYFYNGGTTVYGSTDGVKNNTWIHLAIIKSGSSLKIFENGINTATTTTSTNLSATSFFIGGHNTSWGEDMTGFVSDAKITLSDSVYTFNSDFTPPTAPISSSNALLHIKGTDASIVDKSQGSNLKLAGNTTGSTTQAKFSNTKSMHFDGTGDYISIPADDRFVLGTNDMTIEFWLNLSSSTDSWARMIECGSYNTNDTWHFAHPSQNSNISFIIGHTSTRPEIITTTSLSYGTWYHIAVARSGNTLKLFLDGTQEGGDLSYSGSLIGPNHGQLLIGTGTSSYNNSSPQNFMDGYIQDLRVTKGLARYTANFTPPTAPLEG